jgi:GDP-L-fucose synthase
MTNYLDFYKGKKVMIPGGNGFFGTHIREVLKDSGAEIIVPDREKEGLDFRRYADCRSYIAKHKPDILINCAANQGGIGYHSGRQAELFMDNMLMGNFLMQAAQEEGVAKFVNIVAGCSYPGYLEKDELNEEDYWNGRIHESIFSYGFPRKASVEFGLALKKQFGFNSIHLIMANMYGPGEHFNPAQSKALAGLLKKLYEAKRDNAPRVEIWGTGRPVRDWLYVKDGAEAILRAGAMYDDVDPLNIATGVGVSVADLARTLAGVVGYSGELFFDTTKSDGALKKTFGVHKMKEKLDWLPKTSLEAGVKETLEWLDKNYEHAIAH